MVAACEMDRVLPRRRVIGFLRYFIQVLRGRAAYRRQLREMSRLSRTAGHLLDDIGLERTEELHREAEPDRLSRWMP